MVEGPSKAGMAALRIARREIGLGEEGKNNEGFHVNKYRQGLDVHGPWCARFVFFCLLLGAWGRGKRKAPVRATGSARKLAKRLKRAGTVVRRPLPGDFILWDRKGGMHINICSSLTMINGEMYFKTIDGNKGKTPALVDEFVHKLNPLPKSLVCIVRLP